MMQLPPGMTAVQSRIVSATAEEMLSRAIAATLESAPEQRARLFRDLTALIATIVALNPGMREWTVQVFPGTDGSTVFRGGIGHSLVVDPGGRLWRARTYEDFHTNFLITPETCEIESMEPDYTRMREYVPR
jgi:hypothetical protein